MELVIYIFFVWRLISMKTIKYLSKPLNKQGFVEGRQDYCLEDTV